MQNEKQKKNQKKKYINKHQIITTQNKLKTTISTILQISIQIEQLLKLPICLNCNKALYLRTKPFLCKDFSF